jgi:hypothetical protein
LTGVSAEPGARIQRPRAETRRQIKMVLLVARMQIEADKSLGSASTPSSSSSNALASFRSGEPKGRGAQSLLRARFARLLCAHSARTAAAIVSDETGVLGVCVGWRR